MSQANNKLQHTSLKTGTHKRISAQNTGGEVLSTTLTILYFAVFGHISLHEKEKKIPCAC